MIEPGVIPAISPESYATFLGRKRKIEWNHGVEPGVLPDSLFDFQRDLVTWALRKGRAAIFADTGMGKTLMQLAWAQCAAERTLILAPLAVARQTVREGERWGIPVTYARSGAESPMAGITITNYEMARHFDAGAFGAVVLDESSILKAHDGKTRTALIRQFAGVPMRLCCTATPAPNDVSELANHAEFLGILSRSEMLASFFVHDDEGWRLKGHARGPFFRWMASWGMCLKRPSDLGYPDDGYELPPLTIEPVILPTTYVPAGQLFSTTLKGVGHRAAVRRDTVMDRVAAAADLAAAEPDEPWLFWVGTNDEQNKLRSLLPNAISVEGKDDPQHKADALASFADGGSQVLITKLGIAGFGMNFQRCARMAFVGLSDSYEQYYQGIRRCWRYGQERPVRVHVVLTEPEEAIYENVLRKEREAESMGRELVAQIASFARDEIGHSLSRDPYEPGRPMRLPAWLSEAL